MPGMLVINVKEKNPAQPFDKALNVTVVLPNGRELHHTARRDTPARIPFEGRGKHKVVLTTDVGKGTRADFDQEKLWNNGWAPTDAHRFVAEANNDFSIAFSLDVDGNNESNEETVTFEVTPIAPVPFGTGSETEAQLTKCLTEIAQQIPQWISTKNARTVAKEMRVIFGGEASAHSSVQKDVALADSPIELLYTCAQCTSLYTTPGTIYYMNTTWYYNCRANCTP